MSSISRFAVCSISTMPASANSIEREELAVLGLLPLEETRGEEQGQEADREQHEQAEVDPEPVDVDDPVAP